MLVVVADEIAVVDVPGAVVEVVCAAAVLEIEMPTSSVPAVTQRATFVIRRSSIFIGEPCGCNRFTPAYHERRHPIHNRSRRW